MAENSGEISYKLTDVVPIPKEPLTPESFAQILMRKHIPTMYDRSVNVAALLLDAHPPALFLNRLANGLDFIGKESFFVNLKKMAHTINQYAGDNPLHYVYFPKSRSSNWIYTQLRELGMKEAKSKISTGEGDTVSPREIKGKNNFLIIEDWLISGAHVQDNMSGVIRSAERENLDQHSHIQTFVLYASAQAEEKLKDIGVGVWVADAHRMPLIEDKLTIQDIAFLNEIGDVLPRGRGEILEMSDNLTTGWWCIPDNIPRIFTDVQSKYRFIEPKLISQPY